MLKNIQIVLNQPLGLLTIFMVIALSTTSKLKDFGEGTSPDYLDQALKGNDKAEVPLIRYMSDDVKVTEPNAIYLQCVVPQVGVKSNGM